jgi:hypothetical protein
MSLLSYGVRVEPAFVLKSAPDFAVETDYYFL